MTSLWFLEYVFILFQTTPTVKANPGLNVAEAATTLRNAMKGFGTNEDKIIGVLTTCSNSQRQEIAKAYNAEFGRVNRYFYQIIIIR